MCRTSSVWQSAVSKVSGWRRMFPAKSIVTAAAAVGMAVHGNDIGSTDILGAESRIRKEVVLRRHSRRRRLCEMARKHVLYDIQKSGLEASRHCAYHRNRLGGPAHDDWH